MSTIIVRSATEGDIDVVADMTLSLAKETEDVTLDYHKIKKDIQDILKDCKDGKILVAVEGLTVVGFVLITGHEWSQWNSGRILWLASAYIKPHFRRKKVGKALYDEALKTAQAEGAIGLRSYVMLKNTLSIKAQLNYGMKMAGYVVMEHLFELDTQGD
jgi:ribosomal protein S18 acetylase RimI-like enzyme